MADNTIANAIKFLKGEEKSLPATKTEGQVYFAYKNVGTAEKPSYTGAIYIDTPIGGTQNRIKMTANADIADKAFNDSAGLNIRETYLSSLGYTDDGKQTILIKGSGNNQTRIALPIASTTKSGIVTTDAQSFGGTKTFTTINSTNLTITGTSGFNYSGIETATESKIRPIWFADSSSNGKPVINTNFTYNPATQTLSVANLSGTADKANKDNAGDNIRNTYIKNITVNGTTLTFTKGSGATSSITLQDNNNAVTQTAIKSSDYTNWRTVLWGASNSATEGFTPTTVTDGAFTSDTLTFQPSSGTLKAIIFKGNLSGNASTATNADKLDGFHGSPSQAVNTYVLRDGSGFIYTNYINSNTTNSENPSISQIIVTNGDNFYRKASLYHLKNSLGSMPASDVYAWAKASSKPTYSWGEITGKPSTFTPSSHSHYSLSTIGDQRSTATTPDSYSNTFVFQGLKYNSTIGITGTNTYSYVLGLRGWLDPSGGDSHELAFNDNLGILTRSGATTWNAWRRILDSSNYTEYTVTKSGSGASGTWGINISGSSASCTGNSTTATKLQTARTISLTGSVTGSGTFDGSGNLSITTSTNHSHSQYLPLAGGTMSGTSFITWPDSGNWSNNNNNVTFPVSRGGLQWHGQSDSVKLFSQETASDNLELVLQFGDDNSNGLSIRNSIGTQTARIAANGNITASSFIGNLSGNASTATNADKLDGFHGSPSQAVNTYVLRDGSGFIYTNYINSNTTNSENPSISQIIVTNGSDNFYRKASLSHLKNSLGSMPASDVYAWAKASSKPSYSWSEITGKPSTFTPSGHSHSNLSSLGNIKAETGKTSQSTSGLSMQQTYNNGYPVSYGNVLNLNGQGQGQILVSWAGNGFTPASKMYFRGKTDNNAGDWSNWNEVIDSSNIGSQSVNYANSAGSVAWGNVSGKPSSFTPASHTHPYLPLAGGTMTGTINFTSNKLACNFRPESSGYRTGIMHQTYGSEALVFATTSAFTSFIFKCGQDPTSMTNNTWANITPSMQIIQQSVYINSLIANTVTSGYNLYVNGTTRCNGTLGVGNGSSAEIDFFPNSASTIGARIKAYNDRIEFVFS